METQPEIATSPIGKHYYICQECNTPFIDEGDENSYDEDQTCEECTDLLDDNYYYEDRDDEIHFADPGGTSALRAEHGVRNGKCESCSGVAEETDNFCRNCGKEFNQRNISCSCGRPNMLTAEDKALGYCCDVCADARERDSE
jgi:hypothetical protein